MHHPPPNHVFSVFSFIGFILCAVPFWWHLEAWNTGTCLYMAWVGLGCLNYFINSLLWNNNLRNFAPVWCDISTHYMIMLNVAVPAASLCINRRLYKIATVKAVMITRAEKRRNIMVDLAIGLGIPILQLPFQYIVAGHRYDLYEDFGPYWFTWNTVPAYPLSIAWPLAIGVVSAVYCSMTIYTFWKKNRQFSEMLSSNRNLNKSRYWRLMALAALEVCGTIPISIWVICFNVSGGVNKWKSWSDTHWHFSKVEQIPSVIWKNDYHATVGIELTRWFCVLCAFLFFGFFGFADEARKHYRLVYTSLSSRLGISTTTSSSGVTSSTGYGSNPNMSSKGVTLPVFISKNGRGRADSFGSFSDKLSTSISVGDFPADIVDFKSSPYSPTESTASSSSSKAGSVEDLGRKSPEPEPLSAPPPAVTHPTPTLEISTVPRHIPDTPVTPTRPTSAYTVDVV